MNPSQELLPYDRFYEREWSSYNEMDAELEWDLPKHFNIAEYICERWSGKQNTPAIIRAKNDRSPDTITYNELSSITGKLANYFRAEGLSKGDRVCVTAPQKPETVVCYIAAWKVGAVPVPLSSLLGPKSINYRIEETVPEIVIVDTSQDTNFEEVNLRRNANTILDLNERSDEYPSLLEAVSAYDDQCLVETTKPDDDGIIIFTSGTTGDPKGVLHGHRKLLANVPSFMMVEGNLERHSSDVLWAVAEWSWSSSLFHNVLPALFYGIPVIAYDRNKFDPKETIQAIDTHNVTIFNAPATALRKIVNSKPYTNDLSSVRVIASAGEAFDAALRAELRSIFGDIAIHEAYGQTEALGMIGDCSSVMEIKPDTIGLPIPGRSIEVLDEKSTQPIDEPNEVGQIGIWYEDEPLCFKRYWNRPEETEKKIQNGWLLTGDLGTKDEDGYFSFIGRKDNIIISSGYRISPDEVEECVNNHHSVADCGVVAAPDEERGKVPMAFVVLKDAHEETNETKDSVKEFVRENLAKYKYPRVIKFTDSLPKTTNGKLKRAELEKQIEEKA